MLGVTIVVTLVILAMSNRSFGGITGDVLGSTNELTRLASLMVFVSL
jgi:adenosylcobinamide-GDP ribazoletransferase